MQQVRLPQSDLVSVQIQESNTARTALLYRLTYSKVKMQAPAEDMGCMHLNDKTNALSGESWHDFVYHQNAGFVQPGGACTTG